MRALVLALAGITSLGCSRSERAEQREARPPASAASVASAAPGAANAPPTAAAPEPAPALAVPDASVKEVPVAMPEPPPPPEARPDASGPAAVRAIFDGYGFPVVAYVEPLCARRVARGAGQLTWDAFVSELAPEELIAAFKKRLGEAGFSVRGQGGSWRLPAGSPAPRRTIVVSAPGEPGPHDTCAAKPGRGARSVLLLTRDD